MAANIRLPVWSIFCYLCVYAASKREKTGYNSLNNIKAELWHWDLIFELIYNFYP